MASRRQSGIHDLLGFRRVLVVDDQEDAAELLGMLLTEHGHAARLAHDGESALALAREFLPQVALLDLGLPGMDGYQLAARLRESHRDCRLIAISGYCAPRDRERSLAAGFECHLSKPFSFETLLLTIDAVSSAPPTESLDAQSRAEC